MQRDRLWLFLRTPALLVYLAFVVALLCYQAWQLSIAPVGGKVCLLILVLAVTAIFLLAGITEDNWGDRRNAAAVTLLGLCFALHGIFITGAATFGPKLELNTTFHDMSWMSERGNDLVVVWNGDGWVDGRLPRLAPSQYRDVIIWAREFEYSEADAPPVIPVAYVEMSLWDGGVLVLSSCNRTPPIQVRKSRTSRTVKTLLAIAETIGGGSLLGLSVVVWRKAHSNSQQRKLVGDDYWR